MWSTAMAVPVHKSEALSSLPDTHTESYIQPPDYGIGTFLPSGQSVNLSAPPAIKNVSPRIQLKLIGVSIEEPESFISNIQFLYSHFRKRIVLYFEPYDIIYPFHAHW